MNDSDRFDQVKTFLSALWQALLKFPWRNTADTLQERFREDRLGLTASSLTFTTTISLVPLFTLALAVFSAFPMFARMQADLQSWLVRGLVPDNIAKQVISYLGQFSSKAGQMGWVGAAALLVTALALILTIDRKLNDIWRVRKTRGFTQRVLVYWAVLTLGPLLLAGSLSITSYAISASAGLIASKGAIGVVLDTVQFSLAVLGMAALFKYVPNTKVRWTHALTGGLFVATGLELAKKLLALYLSSVPTYSVVYGTFATVPILLVWIYLVWVIVLLGAVVTAYLPSLLAGIARRGGSPGWNVQLALEVVGQLVSVKDAPQRGFSLQELAQRLRVDPLQLEEPMGALSDLDWVGRLDEDDERYVLLADPSITVAAPLLEKLLLDYNASTAALWNASGLSGLSLQQVLARHPAMMPLPLEEFN
ncbi:YihY family inner membrane protein [Hydrogenophaga sp. 5NK40-0174]|uniref:YihY family inner membrane protein n=1 Tax=Hydrogenophaga sp. 5NK40-0174 TaxID=3127649 RepID=UPI0031080153